MVLRRGPRLGRGAREHSHLLARRRRVGAAIDGPPGHLSVLGGIPGTLCWVTPAGQESDAGVIGGTPSGGEAGRAGGRARETPCRDTDTEGGASVSTSEPGRRDELVCVDSERGPGGPTSGGSGPDTGEGPGAGG
ncbi:hypothetical protein Taro_015862 [Colocasia esculenta]|uniref:Uncharacterized protein n=1 Tax=Colocasia esculenta TaxID=4460 RepID=A0A843UUH3_COLES|nr:hypothetical protein [Colocasia esculenta]